MTVLVDDHLLLAILSERSPLALDKLRRGHRVFTTGLWYHRMCRALAGPRVTGSLSARLVALPTGGAERVVGAAIELPADIGLVSMRDLAWPMAEVLATHRLNLITLEAAAAARELRATIAVAEPDDGPLLRSVAADLDIPMHVVPL